LLVSLLRELYRLESCNLALEEDEAKLWWLDYGLATEKDKHDFVLLGGWLSEKGARR
jgi:hypothetical protein